MVITSSARPLLVPAADVLAKNMRAQEQHSQYEQVCETNIPTQFFLGVAMSHAQKFSKRQKHARFQRAAPSVSNPLFSLGTKIITFFSKQSSSPSTISTDTQMAPPLTVKVATFCEKISGIVSNLPHPTIIFLAESLIVLSIRKMRPHWFDILAVQIVFPIILLVPLVLAVFWRRSELFKMIRDQHAIFSHPAERRLDSVDAALTAREQLVLAAQKCLKRDNEQLAQLKKVLKEKDNIVNADGIIIPSRKAAVLIVNGALGAEYDMRTGQGTELQRRLENVQKFREQYRKLVEDSESLKENQGLHLMNEHASMEYSEKTKELKLHSSNGNNASEKGGKWKTLGNSLKFVHLVEEARRTTLQNKRVARESTDMRQRKTLFRRNRRESEPVRDTPRSMGNSARRSDLLALSIGTLN